VNTEIIELKKRIIEENINNTRPRRKFSSKLKKDITIFVNNHKLSSANAGHLIGIGNTTIEKWKRNEKKQFRKVNASIPSGLSPKKKPMPTNINAIKFNQVVLIAL